MLMSITRPASSRITRRGGGPLTDQRATVMLGILRMDIGMVTGMSAAEVHLDDLPLIETEVLVVGAGPTGLMAGVVCAAAACQRW